eukprot:3617247-Pleurochrysis_carterae.AAC.1
MEVEALAATVQVRVAKVAVAVTAMGPEGRSGRVVDAGAVRVTMKAEATPEVAEAAEAAVAARLGSGMAADVADAMGTEKMELEGVEARPEAAASAREIVAPTKAASEVQVTAVATESAEAISEPMSTQLCTEAHGKELAVPDATAMADGEAATVPVDASALVAADATAVAL